MGMLGSDKSLPSSKLTPVTHLGVKSTSKIFNLFVDSTLCLGCWPAGLGINKQALLQFFEISEWPKSWGWGLQRSRTLVKQANDHDSFSNSKWTWQGFISSVTAMYTYNNGCWLKHWQWVHVGEAEILFFIVHHHCWWNFKPRKVFGSQMTLYKIHPTVTSWHLSVDNPRPRNWNAQIRYLPKGYDIVYYECNDKATKSDSDIKGAMRWWIREMREAKRGWWEWRGEKYCT